MSETNELMNQLQTNNEEDAVNTPSPADELAVLKQRAKLMGLTFSNNISVETLRAKIQAKLDGEAEAAEEDEDEKEEVNETPVVADQVEAKPARKLTRAEEEQALRDKIYAEEMALVRLKITNLNPAKRDLPGEILTVANSYLGSVKKFIPFGEVTENGYHVPMCLYRMMKEREFTNIRTIKDSKGRIRNEVSNAKEFALEILPPLTEAELKQLAAQQAAAMGME